jgi:hypothetical protein
MQFISADFQSATVKGDKVKMVFEASALDAGVFDAIKHTSETVTLCIDPIQLNLSVDPVTGEVRDIEKG